MHAAMLRRGVTYYLMMNGNRVCSAVPIALVASASLLLKSPCLIQPFSIGTTLLANFCAHLIRQMALLLLFYLKKCLAI